MKRMLGKILIFLLCLSAIGGALYYAGYRIRKEVNGTLLGTVLYIDPGHGGYDGGTTYGSLKEADINLAIAKKIFKETNDSNSLAIMTRTSDYDLSTIYSKNHKRDDLKARVEAINHSGANVLISIHLNSMLNRNIKGPMVYFRSQDLLSEKLALSIQKELNIVSGLLKIIHPADYYLFRHTTIPAVIVECGFLSNNEERELLISDSYQERLAKAIYSGFSNYWLGLSENKI